MAFAYSPKIVTDGLVFAVDAANRKSYTSGSDTWYDLSGNGNHGTLTNGPGFDGANGGSLVFDGTNDYFKTPTITNFKTISLWVNPTNQGSGWRYLLDARPGANAGWFTAFEGDGGEGSNWQYQYVNGVSTSVDFYNLNLNKWNHLVIIANNNYTSTINFTSRYTNNEYILCNISNIHIYNRALTPSEITQNYNALKSRFGL